MWKSWLIFMKLHGKVMTLEVSQYLPCYSDFLSMGCRFICCVSSAAFFWRCCGILTRCWAMTVKQTRRQWLLLGSGQHSRMEVLLEVVFPLWPAQRLYHVTDQGGVKWVGWWAVRGLLQFSYCEPLLLEAGSWGTGIVWEPRVRGTSTVESHYWAMTGEDTAVNCRVCELVIAL
jgi:hypothetical protein